MIFRETPLPGAWVLEPERFEDERGFFARTYCRSDFAARGLETAVDQCSVSFNHRRGTLRGLHFQIVPHEEASSYGVTRGVLCDVIVDLRPGSATFRKHFAIVLSADLGNRLYIPKGMAHGFLTLENGTEVSYQISEPYVPEAARGSRWDDPAFAIPWPEPVTMISEKDRSWPLSGEDPMDLGTKCTASSPRCSRSAAASPATALRETLRDDRPSAIPLDRPRSALAAPGSSTGRCRASGTSATRGQGSDGPRVVDFQRVEPPRRQLQRARARPDAALRELRPHLHTLADQPDLIPYRTSYYDEAWGFCLRAPTAEALPGRRVRGLHRLDAGGRLASPTASASCRATNERRGPDLDATSAIRRWPTTTSRECVDGLARPRAAWPARGAATYRFLFAPGTIGSITWLARNEERAGRIAPRPGARPAWEIPGRSTYKRSRRGDAEIDRAAPARAGALPASPFERRSTSPLRLRRAPVLLARLRPARRLPHAHALRPLSRIPHLGGRPRLRPPAALAGSLRTYLDVVDVLEGNRRYLNLNPKCEPQLGRRGLYRTIGGR